jgi:hypothetical protein
MRHTTLPNAALAAFLSLCGCAQTEPMPAPASRTLHSFSATGGNILRSTLAIENNGDRQHLRGVTQFNDGSCLDEDATTDHAGRLVRGEYTLTRSGAANEHVVLDPRAGVVKVSGAVFPMRWSVPNDLPWVWAPTLGGVEGGRTVATPLAAIVTARGAHAASAVRAIDLAGFKSDSVMSDQLVVRDGADSELVVVGDDAVTVRAGMPSLWHVTALNQNIQAQTDVKATQDAFVCTPVARSES